jgi:urea-proton symporter
MSTLWLNVLIILALGAVFILSSWYISRKVSTADEYISGNGKLGVAFGTTSLLAFWITGNTIMAAPEAAYGMGVIGSIAYSFLGGVAVVAFSPLGRRIHEVIPNGKTVGDFFRFRFDRKNYIFFLVMCFIYVFGLLMTQGIGGGLLLEQVFSIPYELAVALTFIIVIIYATIGGFSSVTGIAFFQVMLIFVVVIVVPPIVYFSTGVTPIYEGMLEFAPEKLDLFLPAGILFMFAGAMLGIGEVFMDNTFWQRAYAVRKESLVKIFSLAGIGWFFVPLAVATLAFVAIGTNQAPAQINQVAPFIAEIYGGNFVSWVFLVGVWSALASTIAAILNALVSLILNDVYKHINPLADDKKKMKIARLLTIGIGILALVLSLPKMLTMLQMLIFLGVINAAFVFPIIYGLFWKKLHSNTSFVAAILAIIGGYIVYYTIGSLQGVVMSGWISFLVCWIGSYLKPANYDWEILRKVGKTL